MSIQIAITNAIRGYKGSAAAPPASLTSLMISGTFTSPTNRLYSISNLNNTANATFNTNIGSGLSNYVWQGTLYGDKILLGGFWATWDGTGSPRSYFIELNKNGTISRTGLSGGFNNSVRCFVVQPDNKIIMAGTFTSYAGTGINRIIRLNSDFSIDGTFNPGTGFPAGEVNGMVSDGTNIYCTGNFTTYNGTTRNRFVKIRMSDGADVTGTNSGFNGNTFGIAIVGDDLYIGGDPFTTFNGTTVPQGICKINKNTLVPNSTFTTNMTNAGADARINHNITTDSNFVYVSGNFNTLGGISKVYVGKFSFNGVVDTSFPAAVPTGNILYGTLFKDKTRYAIAGNNSGLFQVYNVSTNAFDTGYNITTLGAGIGAFVLEF
jgi:hypothetical protein